MKPIKSFHCLLEIEKNKKVKSLQVNRMLLMLFVFGIFSSQMMGQNPAVNQLNTSLRNLFAGLAPPTPSKLFLYEMSAKSSPAVYWSTNSSATIEPDTWQDIYAEMYHSAYDTLPLLLPDSIFPRYLRVDKNIVPLFILNYDYNKLVNKALTSGDYFDFNLKSNTLKDKQERASPYTSGSIFAVTPFDLEYSYSNPTFRIDPAFIFTDPDNSGHFIHANNAVLKIDFDDGNGYLTIDPTSVTDYQVNYSSDGIKQIKTAIFNEKNVIICSSNSKIKINSPYVAPLADETFSYPGIKAELYHPCGSSATRTGKLVIYLSGFDAMDCSLTNKKYGRNCNDIYRDMIRYKPLADLRNFGYSFLIVDWKSSQIDIRFSAFYLVNLLEKLKCDLKTDAEQFVIVGESMGGLVARYALSYMESDAYLAGDVKPFFQEEAQAANVAYLEENPGMIHLSSQWRKCFPEKRHNTRLLITLDTPNQGANIPLSLQYLYRKVESAFSILPVGQAFTYFSKAHNFALNGMAAKEMLYYHIDYKNGDRYTSAPQKGTFFNQLAALGNYPKYCKLVGLSNGDLTGFKQVNSITGVVRAAGDLLLGIHLNKSISVLGNTIPLFSCNADFNSNPNGLGPIVQASMGIYFNFPILNFFGVSFLSTYIPLVPNFRLDADVLPLCTSSGGYLDLNTMGSGDGGLFEKPYIYTNGTRFCFVPLQSALDYGVLGSHPNLGSDIEALPINTKLAATPYSVIIAYPGSGNGNNMPHLNYRDPLIYNSSIKNPSNYKEQLFYSCNLEGTVLRSLLCLEIGDEELYLENTKLAWPSCYQAEFDIHVNERNKYFEYPNYIDPTFVLPAVYSKNADYSIESTGFATFFYDSQNQATGIGLSYSAPISNAIVKHDAPLSVCCHDFYAERISKVETLATKAEIEALSVWPNPSNGNLIQVQFHSQNGEAADLILVDSFGKFKVIHNFTGDELKSGKAEIDYSAFHLKSGLYLLKLSNSENVRPVKWMLLNNSIIN